MAIMSTLSASHARVDLPLRRHFLPLTCRAFRNESKPPRKRSERSKVKHLLVLVLCCGNDRTVFIFHMVVTRVTFPIHPTAHPNQIREPAPNQPFQTFKNPDHHAMRPYNRTIVRKIPQRARNLQNHIPRKLRRHHPPSPRRPRSRNREKTIRRSLRPGDCPRRRRRSQRSGNLHARSRVVAFAVVDKVKRRWNTLLAHHRTALTLISERELR